MQSHTHIKVFLFRSQVPPPPSPPFLSPKVPAAELHEANPDHVGALLRVLPLALDGQSLALTDPTVLSGYKENIIFLCAIFLAVVTLPPELLDYSRETIEGV